MSRLTEFYRGRAMLPTGETIDEVLSWDAALLERRHDYIQWLFPLQTASAYNPDAPLLDTPTIVEFRGDPELRKKLVKAFRTMLAFYGFACDDKDRSEPTVTTSPAFEQVSRSWLKAGNHNLLRITRILASLRVLGLGQYANALFDCLESLRVQFGPVIGSSFQYWQQAVRTD